ncbi:MAG: FAD-dependent oxidoreductase [Treponema sp.]|jgi:fumarate reductase flavoprotein subunit|nr:FAD-dependent oxidoreductase [Treponema sp.]
MLQKTENRTAGKAISRRSFLIGASALGAAAAAGSLLGCETTGGGRKNDPDSSPGTWKPSKVHKVYDTDILIVGAGGSGLACALQSALNGAKLILIEKGEFPGGNANFVEGMFAIGSRFQREKGIDIKPVEIINAELSRGQYRANGALWMDLCTKSAANIDWLVEQGILYSGVIDDYYGGLYPTFHWFKDAAGGVGYVPPMIKRLEDLGAPLHLKTAAKSLIVQGGKVSGVYAEGPEGVIQYNAKAVIFATGSFGGNPELIKQQGWDITGLSLAGSRNASGDGYRMARAVGAKDFMAQTAQSIIYRIEAFPFMTLENASNPINGYFGPASGGPVLWVNEDCDRYANEAIRTENLVLQCVPGKGNKANYCLFDQHIYDAYFGSTDAARAMFEAALAENKGNCLYKENSLEALAGHFRLDPAALKATLDRYNALCAQGRDDDYGKGKDFLVEISKPPYYIAQLRYSYYFAVGGITTDKYRQVLDDSQNVIPGLYAIGLDGHMMYRNVYTINMPGTAFGNQVNSGRAAANHALRYIRS